MLIQLIISWLRGEKFINPKGYVTVTATSKEQQAGAKQGDLTAYRANLANWLIKKEHAATMTEYLRFPSQDSFDNPLLTFLFSSADPKGKAYEAGSLIVIEGKTYIVAYKFNEKQAADGYGNLEAKLVGVSNDDRPSCIDALNNLSSETIACLRVDVEEFYKTLLGLPPRQHRKYISEYIAKLKADTGREFDCIKIPPGQGVSYVLVELIPFNDIDWDMVIRMFMCSSVVLDLAAEVVLTTGSEKLKTELAQALANCTRDKFFEDCKIADGFSSRFQLEQRPLLVDRLIQIFQISGDVGLVRKLRDWKDEYHEHDIKVSIDPPKESPLVDLEIKFNEFEENSLEVEGELAIKKIGWGE